MAKQRAPGVCPICGTRVGEAATRCIVCGADLTGGEKPTRKRSGRARRPVSPTAGQPTAIRSTPISPMGPDSFPSVEPEHDPAQAGAGGRGRINVPLPAIVGGLLILLLGGLTLMLLSAGINPFVAPTVTITPTLTPQPTFTPRPTSTPTPLPTRTPLPPIVHKVQEGDSCIRLAVIYDLSVQSILQLNGLSQACPLFVGQELLVPQLTPTLAPTATNTLVPEMLTQQARPTHVVSAGESLSSVAAYYGVSFTPMAEVNGKLPPDYAITIGEVLTIPIDIPAPTEGPTPTNTSRPPYPAPRLLNPPDGTSISAIEQTVSLQWTSVAVLQENEAYLVTVEDVTANAARQVEATTLTTRYIVTVELKPYEALPHVFKWTVVTIRQVGTTPAGKSIYEPVGATSAERTFTWTGIGVVPTVTATSER